MFRKLFLMISIIVLAAVTGNCLAQDTNWTNAAGDNLWTTAGNWSNGLPTAANGDKAKVLLMAPSEVRINAGMSASCAYLVVGDGQSGQVHMTGGTLNIISTGDSWTIIAYQAPDTGIFTIDDGTVTTSNRFFVGFQGNGTLNMNGGTLTIGATFGIGYGESYNTGTGTVNLDGGTISVMPASAATATFQMCTPAGMQGHLNITNGILILKGDCQTVVQGYRDNGYITAFSGVGDVLIDLDGNGNTVVRGQVNPYKARGPYPAGNSRDVPPYAVLKWTAGDTALTHDVYFGTDADSVRNATTSTPDIYKGSQARDANTYTPANLALGTNYYWRVDEVNETTTYKGDLWQFAVANFAAIDDFESYADSAALLGSWSNNSTGATLSLATAGGHEKAKAMKFDYNNANTPLYSEAQTGGPTANWTVDGVVAMDIWYKGDPCNIVEPMYAALEDNNGHPVAVLVNTDPNAALVAEWTPWHINLSDFTNVNLVNVKKLYIGIGSRTDPAAGGAGTVYFDDIKLYISRCLDAPVEDLNGDCRVNFTDFALLAANWMTQAHL